jgi:diadenosine tetraphosphatase ApaH/serine/threonine PP2A family protein phosphatase
MVRELKPLMVIRGNHDKVCAGVEDGEMFNRVALQAAMWTRQKLTRSNLQWLKALPKGPAVVDGAFAISHGTPVDEDAYIFGELEALNVFRHTDFPICFFGHSHFPVIFALSPDAITTVLTVAPAFRFKLKEGVRYLINPGSVGQPRDGNPLCSFAIYDSGTRVVTIHRLSYKLKQAQKKIMDAGLPRPLADRLALGR